MKYFDDDMDELFNKAGQRYPLKTEPGDWDSVRSALAVEQGAAASAVKHPGRLRRFLPLLLLLLIPAVYVILDKENVKVNDDLIGKNELSRENPAKTKPSANEPADDATAGNKRDINEAQQNQELTDEGRRMRNENAKNNQEIIKQSPASVYASSEPTGSATELNKHRSHEPLFVKNPKTVNVSNEIGVSVQNENALTTKPPNPLRHSYKYYISNTNPLTTPSETITLDNALRVLVQPNESGSVPKSEKNKKHKGVFYYGLNAGPDMTTIKGQAVKGLGYSAGIVAGYRINTRLAVEAGLLWSDKKYFTDGKYFSKAGANIPDVVNVMWLDGGCEMLEFPVAVRYFFRPNRNTFFVSGGLTSYIMKKEDYEYGAVAGPGYNYYEGYRTYDRSGDHLFANMQLSAGYKFGLTPKLNLRVEPYVKAPLKKVGIGRMPITSAGLHFSITRDIR